MYTPVNAAEPDTNLCYQFEGQTKIWWDGAELKPGQIGRLIIKENTPLFKLDGDKRTTSRTLRAGEFYRIYAFKPGLLSVGGGYYVERDSKVTYQTPSKKKLEAVACIQANANSPISNYVVFIKPDFINVYDKPNGNKIAEIERGFETEWEYVHNSLIVKKFFADNWVQITHKNEEGKLISGYVQVKDIKANINAFDYTIIAKTSGLELMKSPNSNSKVLAVVPYGTRVDVYSGNDDWYEVVFKVNNKEIRGYIRSIYARS